MCVKNAGSELSTRDLPQLVSPLCCSAEAQRLGEVLCKRVLEGFGS